MLHGELRSSVMISLNFQGTGDMASCLAINNETNCDTVLKKSFKTICLERCMMRKYRVQGAIQCR